MSSRAYMSFNIEEDKRVTNLTPELWLSHTYLQHAQACSKWGRITSRVIMGQTRSFFLNRGIKWPPVFTYDGSVTFEQLKISSISQGWKYQVGKSVLFLVARSYDVWWQKMASNK